MSYKIAIDAGHGSNTAGKRTPDGYREHYINVKVAYYCEQYLKSKGIETVRIGWNDINSNDDADISLSVRQKQIKNAKCDYSVSCHANASGNGASYNSANGVETLISNIDSYQKDSLRFAQCIQNRLIQGTKQSNRGVKKQSLAMCNCIAMGTKASCLVEIAFMTNKVEADLMKTDVFCKEQGEDIAKGICDYLEIRNFNTSSSIITNTPTLSISQTTQPLKIASTKKDIQKYLNTYYETGLIVDGIFGEKSKKAITIAIQKELNKLGAQLTIDGDFGMKSQAAWDKYVGTIKNGSKGMFVTLWQCLLVGFGYDIGGIDGIFGTNSAKATNLLFSKYKITQDSNVSGSDINKIL